ncbi:MAG: hypothetical protein ACI39U_02525, partial [Candidatus Cryptobacteroides sp.]
MSYKLFSRLLSSAVAFLVGFTVSAQSGPIVKGVVVDSNGEPIIQAGVLIEGTTTGVVTDLDGN